MAKKHDICRLEKGAGGNEKVKCGESLKDVEKRLNAMSSNLSSISCLLRKYETKLREEQGTRRVSFDELDKLKEKFRIHKKDLEEIQKALSDSNRKRKPVIYKTMEYLYEALDRRIGQTSEILKGLESKFPEEKKKIAIKVNMITEKIIPRISGKSISGFVINPEYSKENIDGTEYLNWDIEHEEGSVKYSLKVNTKEPDQLIILNEDNEVLFRTTKAQKQSFHYQITQFLKQNAKEVKRKFEQQKEEKNEKLQEKLDPKLSKYLSQLGREINENVGATRYNPRLKIREDGNYEIVVKFKTGGDYWPKLEENFKKEKDNYLSKIKKAVPKGSSFIDLILLTGTGIKLIYGEKVPRSKEKKFYKPKNQKERLKAKNIEKNEQKILNLINEYAKTMEKLSGTGLTRYNAKMLNARVFLVEFKGPGEEWPILKDVIYDVKKKQHVYQNHPAYKELRKKLQSYIKKMRVEFITGIGLRIVFDLV